MGDEIWILGATGRVGREVAARLSVQGHALVLHGRDHVRVEALAATVDGAVRVFAGSLDAALAKIEDEEPAVVVNTIGPFAESAERVIRACPPGTHYVDVGNELAAAEAIIDLDDLARSKRQTLVTSAGFGVYGTEAALLHALADGPTPARVRVDSAASVAMDAGTVGEALARTIVDSFALGGRVVRGGRLMRAAMGADPEPIETPDGDLLSASSWSSADLLAAWRISGAPDVVAASVLVPAGVVRRMLPAISALLRVPAFASVAARLMARTRTEARPAPRAHTWARARVEWPDGRTAQSWLRAGDDFAVAVTSQVASRLAHGEGRAGAFTPGGLFGQSLVSQVGADLMSVAG